MLFFPFIKIRKKRVIFNNDYELSYVQELMKYEFVLLERGSSFTDICIYIIDIGTHCFYRSARTSPMKVRLASILKTETIEFMRRDRAIRSTGVWARLRQFS